MTDPNDEKISRRSYVAGVSGLGIGLHPLTSGLSAAGDETAETHLDGAHEDTVSPHTWRPEGDSETPLRVLLIRNRLSEDQVPLNETVLQDLEVPYRLITSDMVADHDLEQYDVVTTASVQDRAFYQDLAAAKARIESFVDAGGVLLAHVADDGFGDISWGFEWNDPFTPGRKLFHTHVEGGTATITAPLHPSFEGFSGTQLQSPGAPRESLYAGYFPDLASQVRILAVSSGNELPSYVEYEYGAGLVLATLLYLERYPDGLGRRIIENELRYALDYDPAVIVDIDVNPGSEDDRIDTRTDETVSVGIFGSDDLDVSTIDVASLRFDASDSLGETPDAAPLADHTRVTDLNGDGIDDLVVVFPTDDLQADADEEVTLVGETTAGRGIRGTTTARGPSKACYQIDLVVGPPIESFDPDEGVSYSREDRFLEDFFVCSTEDGRIPHVETQSAQGCTVSYDSFAFDHQLGETSLNVEVEAVPDDTESCLLTLAAYELPEGVEGEPGELEEQTFVGADSVVLEAAESGSLSFDLF